jgi:hypothetical protein
MKKLLFSIAFAASLFCTGCQSLAPGGAYSDKYLYTTDVTITSSYQVIDTFLKFELANRQALLVQNPKIKVLADDIRAHYQSWNNTAIALRDAYAGNPSAVNKTNLDTAIAVIQAALTQATLYLTSAPPSPAASPAPAASNS